MSHYFHVAAHLNEKILSSCSMIRKEEVNADQSNSEQREEVCTQRACTVEPLLADTLSIMDTY